MLIFLFIKIQLDFKIFLRFVFYNKINKGEGESVMKKLFLILTSCGILISMCGCGTESVIDNEDEAVNGSVIYVSPADGTTDNNAASPVQNTAEA